MFKMIQCVSYVIGNLLDWGMNAEMKNVEIDLHFGFYLCSVPRPKSMTEGEIYLQVPKVLTSSV